MTVPLPAKKACITSASLARDCASSAVSKVREVPMPITGRSSPELGMGRWISGSLAEAEGSLGVDPSAEEASRRRSTVLPGGD